MKAWLFTEVGAPLELVELPDPEPGPGQVVIDIKAAGLCHSDVSIIEGPGLSWLGKRPIVLGHEVAGVISAIGPEVSGRAIGDRVAIGFTKPPPWGPGLGRDGGYAEKAIACADEIIEVPDAVPMVQAAVATDSGATAYRAVRSVGAVSEGSTVGIIGLGGLGLNGVRFAALAGARVYGVDIDETAFDAARKNGALETFTDAEDLSRVRPDVIVDFAGFGTTTAAALSAVRPGGTVVQVGLGKLSAEISTNDLVLKGVRLIGSLGSYQSDIRSVLELISAGDFAATVEEISFDQIGAGIGRLQRGEVTGRLAARMD